MRYNYLAQTRIFIIGPSATGKSVSGQLAANQLHLPFVDTDQLVSDLVGQDTLNIFAKYGAAYFREVNEIIIERVCIEEQFKTAIIAVGATSNLSASNRDKLKKHAGLIIQLDAIPNTIFQRIQASTVSNKEQHAAHPLLMLPNPLQYITWLYEFRKPYYDSIADVMIRTDGKPLTSVATEIARTILDISGGNYDSANI